VTSHIEERSTAPVPTGRNDREQARRGRPRRWWRRVDRGLLVASLVIAAGLLLIIWGFFTAITGDDGVDRPEAIEELSPVENAVQVLQQEQIRVDLEFGYEATLVIDGVALPTTVLTEIETAPGTQVDLPPTAILDVATGVITFQPSDGAPIESFPEGRHEVRLIYWRTTDGPDSARNYRWSFTVV
jgi:hypothetical protein